MNWFLLVLNFSNKISGLIWVKSYVICVPTSHSNCPLSSWKQI